MAQAIRGRVWGTSSVRHRSIIAILFIVGGLWLAGCTDPSAGATSAPGATSPASPAPATKGDYGY